MSSIAHVTTWSLKHWNSRESILDRCCANLTFRTSHRAYKTLRFEKGKYGKHKRRPLPTHHRKHLGIQAGNVGKIHWSHEFWGDDQTRQFKVNQIWFIIMCSNTLTSTCSGTSKAHNSMSLDSYLCSNPEVMERLTQEQRAIVEQYRNRATGHIMAFERAFVESGIERTKQQARM